MIKLVNWISSPLDFIVVQVLFSIRVINPLWRRLPCGTGISFSAATDSCNGLQVRTCREVTCKQLYGDDICMYLYIYMFLISARLETHTETKLSCSGSIRHRKEGTFWCIICLQNDDFPRTHHFVYGTQQFPNNLGLRKIDSLRAKPSRLWVSSTIRR